MASQATFPPVVCNRTKPPPATADADFIAIDDQSTHRYLCKGVGKSAHLPATEWICSHLAVACGLPVPLFGVVELEGQLGTYYFGSQWQGGAVDPVVGFYQVSNSKIFGDVLAADLFMHNVDRHIGNYLYLYLAGEVVARVIDFSRAWLFNGWPLPPLPLPAACHTMTCVPTWRGQYAASYVKPVAMLDSIAALPDEWMAQILNNMPSAWLSKDARIELRQWWVGNGRRTRVESAKSFLP